MEIPSVIECDQGTATFFYERGYTYYKDMGYCFACQYGTFKVGGSQGICVPCPAGE